MWLNTLPVKVTNWFVFIKNMGSNEKIAGKLDFLAFGHSGLAKSTELVGFEH